MLKSRADRIDPSSVRSWLGSGQSSCLESYSNSYNIYMFSYQIMFTSRKERHFDRFSRRAPQKNTGFTFQRRIRWASSKSMATLSLKLDSILIFEYAIPSSLVSCIEIAHQLTQNVYIHLAPDFVAQDLWCFIQNELPADLIPVQLFLSTIIVDRQIPSTFSLSDDDPRVGTIWVQLAVLF